MKPLLSKSALVAACLLTPLLGVQAQELKIGYVNSDRVLRDALPAKAADTRLKAEFSKREKDLLEMGDRLKAAGEKFDKDQPTMAESERVRRQRDLVEQDREFQRKRREYQEDVTQRRNEELASVVERTNKVIRQIYESEKYDIIVQEAVFAGPRVDITDKVIKALNASGGK